MQPTVKHFALISALTVAVLAIAFFFQQTWQAPTPATSPSIQGQTTAVREETRKDSTPADAISEDTRGEPKQLTRSITVTDGAKHSVPLEDIVGGGPPRDGIPPIDNPDYVSVREATFLTDEDVGLAFSFDGVDRFYPFQILVYHEIVNDMINGRRFLITYCPLCFSGVVFDPRVQGERVEFGTSGKLWNSNLVMYDRKTESLWPQVLGEAVVGEMTGTRLPVLPSDVVRFGEWKRAHPEGAVLSKETGHFRSYGRDPYGDYYTKPGVWFGLDVRDTRLGEKDHVVGIVIDGQSKAYSVATIKEKGTIEDLFAGLRIVARFQDGGVRLYERRADQTLVRMPAIYSFWFAWVAAYPKTELFQ